MSTTDRSDNADSDTNADADVAALVREERLAEAAALAATRGQSRLASELYERACVFDLAADQALLADRGERSLMLAALAKDAARAERALAVLNEAARARVADELARRGHHEWAARTMESVGRAADAAEQWSLAGRAERAADLLERLGDPIAAARALEAGIRAEPERHDWRLLLGRLLLRHGRTEAAVRVLQASSESGSRSAAEKAAALEELVRAFEVLSLPLAAAETRRELEAMGIGTQASVPTHASDRPSAPEPRALLYGRYEIVREVASTASARVLQCVDVLTSEPIALKIFVGTGLIGAGRDALARFEREVAILGTLRHPNIVPLRAYLREGPALALAWMSGGTLRAMLERDLMAPARAVEIAAAVLDALAAAHRAAVIHRDVKPSNVLFDGAGAARLSDFGAAHLGDLAATATAGVIGTLAYMSPEQREGRPATIVSDVYSVGIMLREMLTGRPPHDDARIQPSAVHRDLKNVHDAIVAKLAHPDPAERPRDAIGARRLLLDATWPTSAEPVARRGVQPRPAAPAPEERLEALGGELFVDRWTGRRVRIVPLSDRSLERARAFAAGGGDGGGLDLVLRVDTTKRELWIDAPTSTPLDRPLEKREVIALERALGVLHRAGVVHGHVDREHVQLTERFGPLLRFEPDAAPSATPDMDRLALARMSTS